MASRRISAKRLSVSQSAKQHLKERKRKRKRGVPEKEPELNKTVLWVLVIIALLAGSVLAWIAVFGWDF